MSRLWNGIQPIAVCLTKRVGRRLPYPAQSLLFKNQLDGKSEGISPCDLPIKGGLSVPDFFLQISDRVHQHAIT